MLPSSKALILYNLVPLFVGILAWCFLRERLHFADWISLVMCFGGVFLVGYFTNDSTSEDSQTIGVIMMLGADMFLAS